MPERIRRRRPIAWNQLLNKGHVHEPGRSATRRAQRQALEADIDEYFMEDQDNPTSQDPGAKDGLGPEQALIQARAVDVSIYLSIYLGSISNAAHICNNTCRSLSKVR